MNVPLLVLGLALIALILVDAFETVIQPRRVNMRLRPTRYFFRLTWKPFSAIARRLPGGEEESGPRDRLLGAYAPLALLCLLACWAACLVLGFALVFHGTDTALRTNGATSGFTTTLYMSGVTFFTIGFGDVTPRNGFGEMLAVAEGATGFSFLALIIGYLPIFSTTFSNREVDITLLDARAGSPPSAGEALRRLCGGDSGDDLIAFLNAWERWSANFLESHLSYPALLYFRSQHERQSWLSALTLVLDTCSLILVGVSTRTTGTEELARRQARLTFAMARHAIGDLSQILDAAPRPCLHDRLPPEKLARLRGFLADAGITLRDGPEADRQLGALRDLYEPYVDALGQRLLFTLPEWLPKPGEVDDWATTAWQHDPAVALLAVDGVLSET